MYRERRGRSYSSCSSSSFSSSRSCSSGGSRPRNDSDGHIICSEGDLISNYKVIHLLGEGTFGKVFRCHDLEKSGRPVALKVVRSVEKYTSAAKIEINILKFLNRKDSEGDNHCVEIVDSFSFKNHMCIAFPVYGLSVYEFMKENDYLPYPMVHVQAIAHQLCRAVAFLHSYGLTHTDLKPENLLFVDSRYERVKSSGRFQNKILKCGVKLIDFGSAVFDHEHHSRVVCTRHYRPLEVVLELPWDNSCDMWSVGCILFELYTGETLFQTHSSLEHLAMMERVLGPLPYRIVRKTKKTHYFRRGVLDWERHSERGRYVRQNCFPLFSYMASRSVLHQDLFDLIDTMLNYYSHKRISASAALRHPLFDDIDRVLAITRAY